MSDDDTPAVPPETPDPDVKPVRERIKDAIDARDAETLVALLDPLARSAALRQLLLLEPRYRDDFLVLVPAQLAAALIEEAPLLAAVDLIGRMAIARAAEVLSLLNSDLQADIIGSLKDEDAHAILAQLHPDDAADVRRLTEYDANTAGGLMAAEAFQFSATETVGAVLRGIISDEDDFERYRGQHPYVVDTEGRPIGVVSLRGLLTSKRSRKLSEIMTPPVTVGVATTLDALQDMFDANNFLGLPVVEADGRLVGVVSRSAVHDAALVRSESESLKRQGVVGDELRSMPTWLRSRRRLAWLSANIVLNIIAASVISAYEETLAALITIAVFLPMVSDMSGCSGNQAVGVTMRELALGIVQPRDAMRVWRKEVTVGIINGIALGILIGLVCWIWKGNPWLGVVIGAALAANTVLAVSVGGVVPLILRWVGQDPAAASGPLLTTITDMAGFFLVLSLASLMMPLLGAAG